MLEGVKECILQEQVQLRTVSRMEIVDGFSCGLGVGDGVCGL